MYPGTSPGVWSTRTEGRISQTKLTDAAAGPRSALRLVDMLALIATVPGGATLTELGEALDVPKSSLLAILRVLTGAHYVERVGTSYRLGDGAFDLARKILGLDHVAATARGVMKRLSDLVAETVLLAMPDDGRGLIVYTHIVEGTSSVRYTVPVGDTRPYYASAGGRVVLACRSEAWLADYLACTDLKRLRPTTLHTREAVRKAVQAVQRDGVSESYEEVTDGGAGIAAPLMERDGRLAGILVIGAVSERARRHRAAYRDAVRQAAHEISWLLGGAPNGAAADRTDPNGASRHVQTR